MATGGKITEKRLKRLLEEGRSEELRKLLFNTDPADLADAIEELESEDVEKIFSVMDNEFASEVIVEMEPNDVDEVVDILSPAKIAELMTEMAPDDAVDFYQDLEEDEKADVLKHLKSEDRLALAGLLDYDEDTAGGLMTPELCSVPATATVQQAINAIVGTRFADPVNYIFAVGDDNLLIGGISVSELLTKRRDETLGDVANKDLIVGVIDEDQEEVARKFRKYDLIVMPVVDENKRLVGRITVDDVMDVFHEEASEDMAHLSGAPDIESNEDSPLRIARLRLPWLMITMFTGMAISVIIQNIVGLTEVEALAAFVPVIMAMGGSTGMQASAVTIRSIALGQIEFEKLLSVFGREILVGSIMGITCGVLAGFAVWLNLHYFGGDITHSIVKLAVIVSISMTCAMAFAALGGTIMPIVLHRFDIDPALASGPFVTTGNDLAATSIYFVICLALLKS